MAARAITSPMGSREREISWYRGAMTGSCIFRSHADDMESNVQASATHEWPEVARTTKRQQQHKSGTTMSCVFRPSPVIDHCTARMTISTRVPPKKTKLFVLQSSTSCCNASCISFPNARCFASGGVFFAVLQANTCLWYSHFRQLRMTFFKRIRWQKVATTRTRLAVEQLCCTSASQHYCIL